MTLTDSTARDVRERVVVRFAGDSGDGMQLAGTQFTAATAAAGNDLVTLPDFPAEIRAPRGTLAGVSSFQIHFASRDIATPGDAPDLLVAMNPAALKANLGALRPGIGVVVNEDAFSKANLLKAGYAESPLDDGSLDAYEVVRIPMTTLCQRAAETIDGASSRDAQKARNLFALGLICFMYGRPIDGIEAWIGEKFATKPVVRDVNVAALRAGWNFGETTEAVGPTVEVPRATDVPAGTYRNINGTQAMALGLIAASVRSGLPLTLAAYPITPASELLHELARRGKVGVRTVQAEDEIAAAGIALGASYGGALGVTATSGPGMDLKAETIGLALMLELPLIVIDVQRAGPSTGMPTKTEQSDLLMALYGRHGEAPLPVVAATTPGDCFDAAIEAAQIAVRYRTPVILLSDLFLANSSEPWRIPAAADLPMIDPRFAQAPADGTPFEPYARDEKLARAWILPGTPGAQHRIGGIEKSEPSGAISYDAANHARMTRTRAQKVAGIQVPDVVVDGDDDAEVLVLGWGSTEGALRAGVRRIRERGLPVARAQLRHLNPLPANLGEVLRSYERVVVFELNTGQLAHELRAKYLVDVRSHGKVEGKPLLAGEVEQAILEVMS